MTRAERHEIYCAFCLKFLAVISGPPPTSLAICDECAERRAERSNRP